MGNNQTARAATPLSPKAAGMTKCLLTRKTDTVEYDTTPRALSSYNLAVAGCTDLGVLASEGGDAETSLGKGCWAAGAPRIWLTSQSFHLSQSW